MRSDLLDALAAVAQNRGMELEEMIELVEAAVVTAARKSINNSREIQVKIDRKTGEFRCLAQLTVVEEVEEPSVEISLTDALKRNPQAKLGDTIEIEEKPDNFGRVAALACRNAIMNGIHQIDKQKVCEAFHDKLNQLISGVVRRLDRNEMVIDFETSEGVMRNSEKIPGDEYDIGDHITALLVEINSDKPGPNLLVSRTNPDFVVRLFEREVNEVSDGQVVIKAVAREAGYRTKLAVATDQPRIDPVGACVGQRGARVKGIVHELGGEKIDVINWDPDIKVFAANALKPATITSIVADEARKVLHIKVAAEQLSLAIGKKGMNSRLASRLLGWRLDIKEAEPEVTASADGDFADQVQRAIDALAAVPAIGAEAATILVHNGFASVEGLQAAEQEDIAQLEGIGDDKAKEIMDAVKAL